MLLNTFCHIPRITENGEKKLWAQNVLSWNDALNTKSSPKIKQIRPYIKESLSKYEDKDYLYFAGSLPRKHHWRAYPELKEKCCFLDIETTGLSRHRCDITTIGLYDGKESKVFVNGKTMDLFPLEFAKYSMVVTFNGIMFDMPFIKEKFPEVNTDILHADLRFALARLGLKGGLKRIEKKMGINRDGELDGMTGYDAVRLWYKYKNGDTQALQTLIEYNIADIENLKILMEYAYKELRAQLL